MDYSKKWTIITELGRGGQGVVFRVYDSSFGIDNYIRPLVQASIRSLAGTTLQDQKILDGQFENLRKAILQLIEMQNISNHKALKVLHSPQDAVDFEHAKVRIKNEIKVMAETSHPNLLKIFDTDPDSGWFVSQYHPRGTLQNNLKGFAGDLPKSLKALRPLVAGVAELHKKGIVHRDIKPQNIFSDVEGNLILGDFGLVFFTDQSHTRISGTLQNVGSRDWMPGWAQGMRVEDVKFNFDVFSLGKTLWSMVSGKPFLRLWYYDHDEFNLQKQFPNSSFIHLANAFFAKCVVEHEKDCIENATTLLSEIDDLLQHVELNADLVGPQSLMRCRLCGIGYYEKMFDYGDQIRDLFGVNVSGMSTFRIYKCTNCGNVQFFHADYPFTHHFWKPK